MPLTIDEFCERIGSSKVLSAEDARAVLSSVAENERPTDGESLAALLVRSGKLTAFQAKRICEGKGASLLLGNYVLLDRIGRGGMGDVFKAEHRRMKRVVALKVVKPEILDSPGALKRFQREVETVAKLDHPNVVTAHDADEANGIHFLVMQFVDGRDLSSMVKSQGPLSVLQAVGCVLQAARGLAYAHEQGIVHRDVKPGNMLLDRKGPVKILDLGLATLTARDANANESLTGSEMIVGTLDYMAPEQAQSPKLADERSDIYSLGMTLWFLLTGRAAYEAETVVAKLLAHQQQPVPSLAEALLDKAAVAPSAIQELDAIFQRMASKRPADRYQSMGEVVAALETFQREHRPGSTDATVQLAGGSGGGNLTQRRGGGEQGGQERGDRRQQTVNGVAVGGTADHGIVTDHTASILNSHEDTTANTKRPELPVIVSATKRRGRRATWRQYSLIGVSAALFITAAIGSPLLMLKLSTPMGSIVVTTDQPELEGAHVSLDGQVKFDVGKSGPQRAIRLAADDQHHTLFVSKDGFQPYSRQIRMSDSAPQRVFVHLAPIAKPAAAPSTSLSVSKQPAAGPAANRNSKIQNLESEPGGFAIEFNGKDSYVDLPTLRYDGSHPITLEATIIPHVADEGAVVSDAESTGIALEVNEGFGHFLAKDDTRYHGIDTFAKLTLRRPIHLAAIVERRGIRLYLDGKLQQTEQLSGSYKPGRNFFRIGALPPIGGAIRRPFSGVIDEVRISKIARYASEFTPPTRFEPDTDTLALYHFDEGQGEVLTDSSGNGHHGKIVNAKWVPGIAGGPPASADRRAAEAVLALGGTATIRTAGEERAIEPGAALPQDDFELVRIRIYHQPRLNDADLRNVLSGAENVIDLQLTDVPLTDACLELVAPLPKLEILLLNKTQITGAGLGHLRGHEQLKKLGVEGPSVDDRALESAAGIPNVDLLWLGGTQITDAGLAHLKPMKQLQFLNLGLTQITDVGIAQLRGLTEIRRLVLSSCRVTDASAAYLQDMKKLEELELFNTAVTDAGLAILAAKGPHSIFKLDLEGTAVTDAGLAHLRSLPGLRTLSLSRTLVSDEGLEHLKGLKKLGELKLNRTKITAGGVEELKKSLPECQVAWGPPGKGKGKKSLLAEPPAEK